MPGTTDHGAASRTHCEDKHEVSDTMNVLEEVASRKLKLASQAGTAWDTFPGAQGPRVGKIDLLTICACSVGLRKGRKLTLNLLGTRHHAGLSCVSRKHSQEERPCGAVVKSLASGATEPGFKSQFCFRCDLEHIS